MYPVRMPLRPDGLDDGGLPSSNPEWRLIPKHLGVVSRLPRGQGRLKVGDQKEQHPFIGCSFLKHVPMFLFMFCVGGVTKHGYGSKLNHWGTAGFSRPFHLPGFHFGYLFLAHRHMRRDLKQRVWSSSDGYGRSAVASSSEIAFGTVRIHW